MQEFHIDSSMLCRWLKARDSFEASLFTGNKYRIGSPGRHVTHSDLESELYRWIINKRSDVIGISLCAVRQQMLMLTQSIDSQFKASILLSKDHKNTS
jgi:hypothetical protein